MLSNWKWRGLAMSGIVLAGMLLVGPSSAQARPDYFKHFSGMYPGVEAAAEVKCGVCHEGSDKKVRNGYGKAFGKALGEAKVKDADKIKAALKKAEEAPSAVEGKTFGDLLGEGKLPSAE